MGQTNSEDVILFIALSSKAIKKKNLYDGLGSFASKKSSIDPSDRFNIIIFTESGPVYLENFTFDFNTIIDSLDQYRDSRVKPNIAGGIFVAATFIIDVFKQISDKVFRLLVIIDKKSVKIPDQFFVVLQNLLEKVKDMPFIIDVIHLGRGNKHKNLRTLVQLCRGKFYEVTTQDEFQERLLRLAEKHTLNYSQSLTVYRKDKPFYENLADDVRILMERKTCSVCFQETDETIVQCPNCETVAHMSCWAHWAKTTNIGMPHLFRCHNCFNLLKLDENYVKIVQEGKEPTKKMKFEARDIHTYLRTLEEKESPQIVAVEDPLTMPESDEEDWTEEPEEIVIDDEPDEEEIKIVEEKEKNQPRIRPIPRASERRAREDERVKMIICPVCSAINTSNDNFCKQCGNRLR